MGKKSKKLKAKNAQLKEERKPIHSESKSTSDAKLKYSAAELLDKAEEYLETFENDMARRFCQRALEVEPLNCRALEMSGLLFLQASDPDLARSCYKKAVELQPETGHVKYMYLGQLSSEIEAIQYYQKGIEIMSRRLAESKAAENTEADCQLEGACDRSKEPVCEITPRDISSAYCAIAEIFLTDACFEADAEVRCKESLDKAVETDSGNSEAYHLLASYWLCKDDKQKASEAINQGIALWLPQLRAAEEPEGAAVSDPVQSCSVSYSARINCSKTLIELENYEVASEILELLLDEDDEVVEVWYLLGWINYLLGEDYRSNSRHYLQKGLELAVKQRYEDEQMLSHMNELLTDLGPAAEAEEDIQMDEDDNVTESEDEKDEAENCNDNAMEQ